MTVKASARHNKTDRQLLKDALKKNAELAALLVDLGAELEDDDEGEVEENALTAVPVGTEDITEKATDVQVTLKAISLDEMISNVREAFYKAFRQRYEVYPSDIEYPYIISVYADFVVAKCGMCYHRVDYTIADSTITFTPRDQWKEVEPDWVTKSVPNLDSLLSTVKSVGEDRLGMYLVMFGNEDVRDLGKEFFTAKTQDMLNVFKAVGRVPTFYHHGLDKDVKAEVVGMYDVMVQDDIGIWAETQLDKASKYKDAMIMLAEKGALGSSSGCLPTSRQVNKKSGEIERWAIIEGSLTPTPMDYRQRLETPVEVLKSIYKAAGLSFPELNDDQTPIPGDEKSHESDESQKAQAELELQAMELELIRMKFEVTQ